MTDRAAAIELAKLCLKLDGHTEPGEGGVSTDLARAFLAECERAEKLEAVVAKVGPLGEYIVASLPINLDGNMQSTINLGRSRFIIKQLGTLIQDADALTNGEESRAALAAAKEET